MGIRSTLRIIAAAIFVAAISVSGVYITKYNDAQDKLDSAAKEIIYYQDEYIGATNDKAALELNAASLRRSNSNLVHRIDSLEKRLKAKAKKPGSVITGASTSIQTSDTIKVPFPVYIDKKCDFVVNIKPNDQTHYRIELKNDTLIHDASINNNQLILVYPSREYLNKYNSWLHRLIKLDYRKIDVYRTHVENSNDEIEITGTETVIIKE